MDKPIGIRLPKGILKKIQSLSNQEMEDRSSIIRKLIIKGYAEKVKEMAVEDYKKGKITLSKAAEKADLTIWEMERYLVEKGVRSEYSIDDLREEVGLLE